MNENVIYIFLFTSTQKTAIGELSPSLLESIKSHNLPPSSFQRKEHNFSWNSLHPNFIFWKNDRQRPIHLAVSFHNSKLPISSFFPKNRIFLPSYPVSPQHMKQVVYHIQLPIVKIPNEPQIPSSSKILVPHFFYCRISWLSNVTLFSFTKIFDKLLLPSSISHPANEPRVVVPLAHLTLAFSLY